MTTLKQSTAMLCVHIGCGAIWEGPQRLCPECHCAGVPYREIEELALSAPLGWAGPKMLTTRIQ